jgi:hypothetical protein
MRALTVSFAIVALCAAVTSPAQVPGQPEGVALAEEHRPGPIVLVAEPYSLHFRVPAPPVPAEGEAPLAATITINYLPAGSTDFWGEPCFAWPAAAQTAMNYAASIWATLVNSDVPIVINACWADLDSGILGYSGTAGFYRDFSGAPVASTWYPVSLANARSGSDLNGSNPDMHIAYNKDFHDSGTLYYGTDGNPAYNQYDFVTIVLHEITHGLGFAGSMSVSGSQGSWGFYGQVSPPYYPVAYDRPAEDSGGTDLINTAVYPNPSTALANALRSNAVYFNGVWADAANGGQRVRLYAPAVWSGGSSFSHLDEIFNGTPHALMTYSIPWDEAIHNPGTITMGLLWDIGWTVLTHPLTVTKAGSGSGTVTSSPAGIDCGADCTESFNWGTVVTLTAAASGGSTFAGWSGAGCSGTGTCQVTMDAAKSVTATFTGSQPALTVVKAGTGSGTVTSSPAGIDCGTTCSASFSFNTVVTLTAVASVGSTFAGWSGSGCSGTGTCVVTMDASKSVTATFTANQYALSVAKLGTGTGTVTSSPAGIDCGATCQAPFAYNTVVTLSAVAGAGSTFAGWSGSGCSGTGTCVVTMDAARSVSATFTATTHALTVLKPGTGQGTVTSSPAGIDCGATCVAQFAHNAVVTLTAVAATGSTFAGWSGAGCSGTGTCVVTMDAAKTVTATFNAIQYALTVTRLGAGSGVVTSSPAGISCGATCSAPFNHNTAVTLTAAAATGSTFAGWTGSGCSGTGTCQVTMTEARSVTATFFLNQYALTVSKDGAGTGTVTSSPAGIDCGAACSAPFNYNTSVTLTAAAEPGSSFYGWSGSGCAGVGTCEVIVREAASVTATFGTGLAPLLPLVDVAAGAQSDGNQVLEPGESLVLSPRWSNPTPSAIAATGTMSGFAGPAGATYDITDGSADYGTVAAASQADPYGATGDAYGIAVSDPASRPALHWDTAITETLSTGEVKTWTLHVGDSFTDVPRTHLTYRFVETVLHASITAGCGSGNYCPSATLTRWQMAVFLAKALTGGAVPDSGTVPGLGSYLCAAGGASVFLDVPATDPGCKHIHYIAAEGITAGCGPGNYCPSATLTRWQMAVFLAKAVGPDTIPASGTVPEKGDYNCVPGGSSVFSDVPPQDAGCPYIHYIAAEGITAGCSPTEYCPSSPLQRDQMAVFLTKAFDLALYGP